MFKPLPSVPYSRMYFQDLFDPVQTHALYGIFKSEINEYKDWLKDLGAKRFRVIKCKGNNPYAIICFKWPQD